MFVRYRDGAWSEGSGELKEIFLTSRKNNFASSVGLVNIFHSIGPSMLFV